MTANVPRCSGCRRVVRVGVLACRDCLDRLPADLRAALAEHQTGTAYLAARLAAGRWWKANPR